MTDRTRTRAEERIYAELDLQPWDLEETVKHNRRKREFIPADWRRIKSEHPVPRRKTRITAAIDADVVKWFRAMGHGYQARMNAVLRTFILAMVSKEILSRAVRLDKMNFKTNYHGGTYMHFLRLAAMLWLCSFIWCGAAQAQQSPFGSNKVPGDIQLYDFDNGGEGVAYHDTSPSSGFFYRNESVDIWTSNDVLEVLAVRNEWLEYTIDIASTGNYDFSLIYSTKKGAKAQLNLKIDDANPIALSVPSSGGFAKFRSAKFPARIPIATGRHVLRLSFTGSSPIHVRALSSVIVSNPDTVAPLVSITSLAQGAVLQTSSTVAVNANASDNVGVSSMTFLVNNVAQCTDTASPYSCNWAVPNTAGNFTILARAADSAGNIGQSSITVSSVVPNPGGLSLEVTAFTLKTYTADRFALIQGQGGSGPYTYALPSGLADNDLFKIEAGFGVEQGKGVLSRPEPELSSGFTRNLIVRVTDSANGASVEVSVSIAIVGAIKHWNLATLSTNPGGLTNFGTGVDNSTALDQLRSRMLAEQANDPNVAFELTLPAGQYDHRRPQFLVGIRRVQIKGVGKSPSGSILRNIQNSQGWYDSVHLTTNWDPYQRTSGSAPAEHYGYLIQTANKGANQIILAQSLSALNQSGLAVGRRVWIASELASAYPGYPPHARFFQSAIITGYTGFSAGSTVTLDRTLRHTYQADAPEANIYVPFGRARILFSDPNYTTINGQTVFPGTEVVILRDLRFAPNPNWGVGSPQIDSDQVQVFGAQFALMDNVYMTSWGPQLSEIQILRRVDVVGASEPDAQIVKITMEDSTFGSLGGPNGPTEVEARRSVFRDNIRIGMGKFTCDDCDFTQFQETAPYWTAFTMDHIGPTAEVRITNSRFWNNTGQFQHVFGGSPARGFRVGTDISYVGGASPYVSVPYPVVENPDGTAWGFLSSQVGTQDGGGRVKYMDGSIVRWGTVTSIRAAAGVGSASELSIQWDPGAGANIVSGTALTFYKISSMVFQNVVFNGWTSMSPPSVASFDYYRSIGQSIPQSLWSIRFAP